MRQFKLLFLTTLFFALLSGCTKDPCTDSILGIYDGKCTLDAIEFDGKITISKSSKGDYEVLIEDEILNGGDELYNGTVSEDCGRIEIPLQNITDSNNNGYTIDGYFELANSKLTGEITIVNSGFGGVCRYDMTKL